MLPPILMVSSAGIILTLGVIHLVPIRDCFLGLSRREENNMNAETEAAIQNLGKAFADTGELISIMKRIANSLINIELHLEAMRPTGVQTLRGPSR